MNHSYEELRNATLDILAGREQASFGAGQYVNLQISVAGLLEQRDGQSFPGQFGRQAQMSPPDRELFLEVFWDLFRQGIITLGSDDANKEFPFFRVSANGRKILANQNVYFFHDVSTYEKLVRDAVPQIDKTTLLYLQEAMQAFLSGCILSATVMVGVATEHSFLGLLDTIEKSTTYGPIFKNVLKERSILRKFNLFRSILEKHLKDLTPSIKEDLDTQLSGILSIIRTFRNESGHPSGKIISREQCYVLLNLYIPYCKKIYQLIEFFHL